MGQAARQLECSSTGTSFFEAAAEFATNFVHKHVQVAELSRDNWQVLNSLERIAAKLLKLVEGCPTATAPRRVYSPERSSVIRSVVKLGAAMDGERAGVSAAGDKRALLLTSHQQALLRAVIHALHSKGIECHERMWQVAGGRAS